MIDRSYLPFQSAREYQDRGMMKWMGFFLSEHTTSLDEENSIEKKLHTPVREEWEVEEYEFSDC